MKRTLYRIHRWCRRFPWGKILGIFLLMVVGFGLLFVMGSPSLKEFRRSLWFAYLLVAALTLPVGWYVWIRKRKTPLIDRIIASIPLLYLWSSFIPMTWRIRLLLWTAVLFGMIGCWLYMYYLDRSVRSCELVKCVGFEAFFMGVGYLITAFDYSLVNGLFCPEILLPAGIVAATVAVIMVVLIATRWLILQDDVLSERILCVIIASALTLILTVTTVLHLNYALDFDEPTGSVASVTEKKTTHSTKGGTHYHLILDLNGTEVKLIVSESEYDDVEIGDDYPLAYYEGAFGIPFYLSGE